MGKVLDPMAMGVLALGAVLPAGATYLYNKVTSSTMIPSSITSAMGGTYVKPAVLIGLSSGLAYMASRYGLINNQTAVAAATLSTFLYVAGAVKNAGLLSSVPVVAESIPSLNGMGGYLGGYSGGYLGYLGDAHADTGMGMELYGDAPAEQLFGTSVGAGPQVNIF